MPNFVKSLYKRKKIVYNLEKLNEKALKEDNALAQALQRELPFGERKRKPVRDITSSAD